MSRDLLVQRQVIKFGLERIKAILDYLGNPEKNFKSVLIGGTNGKGSVTFYLSNLSCNYTNLKTGRYTSPHLISLTERFVINEKIVDSFTLTGISNSVINKIKEFENQNPHLGQLTEFEIYTVIAFSLFASENVDIAFLEVGMGGRLDATNVVPNENVLCSIITNISFDHTEYLGNTLEKIAYEKAGIIRKNNFVVTGARDEALNVIQKKADELNSKLTLVNNEKDDLYYPLEDIEIALSAWELIESKIKLNENKADKKVDKRDFLKSLQFPGRFQYFKEHKILIDGAHNPGSALKLRKLIKAYFENKKIVYILGMLDKDYDGFIKNLIPSSSTVICTEPKSQRATKKEILLQCVQNNGSFAIAASNLALSIIEAKKQKQDLIVITGSLYLIGEALNLILKGKILELVIK